MTRVPRLGRTQRGTRVPAPRSPVRPVPSPAIPQPRELAVDQAPDTVEGWKALADGFLTTQCCAFHRNMEISARYAGLYNVLPSCFKWAGMAAIASHHVRLALFPLRLDSDRNGYVDIPRSLGRRRLLTSDVDTIRETNNAIFDDIFWVHLAYAGGGIERLRTLLAPEVHYTPVLTAFEAIDRGRAVLADSEASPESRRAAELLVWMGNVRVLEHEQRALVQPHFDRLSCAFARIVSLGSATSFGVRGARQEIACFTSFYLYSLTRGVPRVLRSREWPRITRYEDRWWWIEASVVPHFQALDANRPLIDASLQRIVDDATLYLSIPCASA